MRLIGSVLCLFVVGAGCAGDDKAPGKSDEVKLERIKAGDIEKVVAANKGKVVVVDVWGEF